MPIYEIITYTQHARERMQERHITPDDVTLALRFGAGRPGKEDTWIYEMTIQPGKSIRVIVTEHGMTARVLTVIRRRGDR